MNTVTQNVASKAKLFNPHDRFVFSEGLCVSEEFNNHILAKQPVTMLCRGLDGITAQTLLCSMTSQQIIEKMLGGADEARRHAVTLDQIATMIDLQPNGEDGELVNNGCANIFCVSVNNDIFLLDVSWRVNIYWWDVGAYMHIKVGDWAAGDKVFRNTTLVI